MSTVRHTLEKNSKLTAEEKKMLRKAAKMPYVPDEDAPELSEEQFAEFRRLIEERKALSKKQTVSLRLTNGTIEKAKAIGESYTSIIANVIENVFRDVDALKKFL